MYDVDDLLDLASRLDPRRRKQPMAVDTRPRVALDRPAPPPSLPQPILRLPTEGTGVALSDPPVTRPRLALPPPEMPSPGLPPRVAAPPETLERPSMPAPMLAPAEVPAASSPVPQLPAPKVSRAEANSLGIPPQPLNSAPRYVSTGDPLQDSIDYERSLEVYKPENHNSRWASIGLGALRGFAQGGIGGALFGAVSHGARPSLDEEYQRQVDLGGARSTTGRELSLLQAGSQLEDAASERAKRYGDLLKIYNPPPDYERVETPDGYVYVDKRNPSGTAVQTGLKAPVKPGARPQTVRLKNEDGSEKVVERGADGVWRDTGLRSAGQPRRRVTVGGETFELPEAEAARVLAQIESANITSGNQYGNQTYEDTVRQIDRDNATAKERYAQAQRDVGELRAAIKDAQEKAARSNNPPPVGRYQASEEDRKRFRAEWEAAQGRVRALAAVVQQNYPDLVGDDEQRWPTVLKSAPEPKTYPQRQPPRQRPKPQTAPSPSGKRPEAKDPLGLFK